MDASKPARPPLRFARVLAVILAFLLIGEAAAQAFVVHWAGKPFQSVFLYLWSPYGLVRNNPELTGNFHITPEGFRDVRRYSKIKPANTFRVVMMGGSVLYAGSAPVGSLPGFVPSDQTISQKLLKRLQADPAFAGVNVEIINAGVNYNRIPEVSSAYLAEYLHWQPDAIIVFGSANNFPGALLKGQVEKNLGTFQTDHPWAGEFQRLVNERSLSSTLEVAFRQGADAFASLAMLHKGLTRVLVENDPFARFALHPAMPPSAQPAVELATPEEEARYMSLYGSYADAMIAAARRDGQKVAFVWEHHLADMKGVKPFSAEEESIYPAAASKRPQYDIDYDRRAHQQWAAMLNAEGVPTVDPWQAIASTNKTVFNDYLHYTANGNDVVAGAVYDQLRGFFVDALHSSDEAGAAAKAPVERAAIR